MQLTNIFYTALAAFAISTSAAPLPVAEPHSNTIAPALITRNAAPKAGGNFGKMGIEYVKRGGRFGKMGIEYIKRGGRFGKMGIEYVKRGGNFGKMGIEYKKRGGRFGKMGIEY